MLSLFGFGKRRRKTTRKTSKKTGHKKPPARLLKICKKYHIKTTRKVGGKRVYKPVKVLAKACLKKAMAAKKHRKTAHRKTGHRKTGHHRVHRRVHRRSGMFGEDVVKPGCGSKFGEQATPVYRRRSTTFGNQMMHDKKAMFGNQMMDDKKAMFGNQMMHDKKAMFGNQMMHDKKEMFGGMDMPFVKQAPSFGKRRGGGSKVSRAGAMKAFRSFYKRHCAGMRRSRFGSGGNPPLGMNMGYEFCPSGMGGVLGAGSTGLFPTPCTSMNQAQAQAEANLTLPPADIGAAALSSFGRHHRKKRVSAVGAKKRVSAVGAKKRVSAVGAKKRASSVGATRRGRCTY